MNVCLNCILLNFCMCGCWGEEVVGIYILSFYIMSFYFGGNLELVSFFFLMF